MTTDNTAHPVPTPAPVAVPETCSVADCDRPIKSRGWCRGHYKRVLSLGHANVDVPLARPGGDPTGAKRLAENVIRDGQCLRWNGKTDAGYARISVGGRTIYAHRLAWELKNGPIPDGLHIDHLCGVRDCVNPTHLEPVTLAENNRRMNQDRPRRTQRLSVGDSCKNGHVISSESEVGWARRGSGRAYQFCRICDREQSRAFRAAKKASKA